MWFLYLLAAILIFIGWILIFNRITTKWWNAYVLYTAVKPVAKKAQLKLGEITDKAKSVLKNWWKTEDGSSKSTDSEAQPRVQLDVDAVNFLVKMKNGFRKKRLLSQARQRKEHGLYLLDKTDERTLTDEELEKIETYCVNYPSGHYPSMTILVKQLHLLTKEVKEHRERSERVLATHKANKARIDLGIPW